MELEIDQESKKCQECCGYGYTECVAYYYGRAECSYCGGRGIVQKSSGVPYPDDYELGYYDKNI